MLPLFIFIRLCHFFMLRITGSGNYKSFEECFMSLTDIVFIVIPIVVAMLIVLSVSTGKLRREYYWAVIPLAAVAMTTLLMTA